MILCVSWFQRPSSITLGRDLHYRKQKVGKGETRTQPCPIPRNALQFFVVVSTSSRFLVLADKGGDGTVRL